MPQSNTPSAFFNNLDLSFILKLDVDSNAIVRECQIYLSTYNATCYKYDATTTGQYRFDFPCSTNNQTKITPQRNIKVFRNNI